MKRWEIRRVGSKRPIVWGTGKTERACLRAIERTLIRDLSMLNPDRLECEIKDTEG